MDFHGTTASMRLARDLSLASGVYVTLQINASAASSKLTMSIYHQRQRRHSRFDPYKNVTLPVDSTMCQEQETSNS